MHDMVNSEVRRSAVRQVISKILFYSKMNISKDALKQIERNLMNYEVEKGVSVYLTAKKPLSYGIKLITKVDLGKQFLYIWWGDNLNKRNLQMPSPYALGLTFVYKKEYELTTYTLEEWKKDYPDFYDCALQLRGFKVELKVFSKAGNFYKEVVDMPGEWLVQTPKGKYFIPNRPIGKLVSGNKLYMFIPNLKMKRNFYKKLVMIV